jgi:hypothetical protein
MSVYNDILEDVKSLIVDIGVYAVPVSGSLPPSNGISLTVAAGAPIASDLSKGGAYQIVLALNGKHINQETVSDALGLVHTKLTQRKTYPSSSRYRITDVETVGVPTLIDREDDGMWLYGSSLRVKFYLYPPIKEG